MGLKFSFPNALLLSLSLSKNKNLKKINSYKYCDREVQKNAICITLKILFPSGYTQRQKVQNKTLLG